MAGPRDYSVGTERALYHLARGTCYAPGCDAPAIRFIEGDPYSNLQIAHIHGANPGSPRYDADMTDEERASFDNVLLLCKPHHELVDRRKPDEYPADTLREWKRQREGDSAEYAERLAGITGEQFELFLEDVAARLEPQREIEVELIAGALVPGHDRVVTGPFEGFREVLDANPDVTLQPVVIARVRNVGSLPVTVKNVDLDVSIPLESSDHPAFYTLHGLNEYPLLNPDIPSRIDDGDSKKWLYRLDTVLTMIDGAADIDRSAEGIHAEISLATGETVRSERVSVDVIRGAFAVREDS